MVTQNVLMTEDESKKFEEELKNAKTQEEQIEITKKLAQQMQDRTIAGGTVETTGGPQLVTNISDAHYDLIQAQGGTLSPDIKYDDILIRSSYKIIDLHGKTLFNLEPETSSATAIFINSDNTKLASFKYGTLTFADKTSSSGMFNPYLTRVNGQVYLAYLYYSPKRNAIMQNKIPFQSFDIMKRDQFS
jgi:hypothetical protein